MARPRKPTAIKKLQGTLQLCRTLPGEPQPQYDLSSVAPPKHLSKDAKGAWAYALSQAPENLLKTLDLSTFESWCTAYANVIGVLKVLKAEGETIRCVEYNKHTDEAITYSKPHPMLHTLGKLRAEMLAYAREMGFTPASRTRISTESEKDKAPANPFEDL